MTPDRKFQLDAVGSFMEGMLKTEDAFYVVLIGDAITGNIDVCSDIQDNDIIASLLEAAAENAHRGELLEDDAKLV